MDKNFCCRVKLAGFIFLLFLLTVLCSSCNQKKASKPTITLAFWGDIYNRSFAEQIVESYNKKKPSVELKAMPIESGYESKLLTMIAGGTSPDIMLLMPYYMADYASRGVLLDLQPYEEKDVEFQSLEKDIWPDLLSSNKFKGVSYSMPFWTNSLCMFYNKTFFDDAGLVCPDESWSLDTLLSAAKKLTKDTDGARRINRFGFAGVPLGMEGWYLYQYIRQNGGRLFNEDKTKCLIDSQESIETIRWCIELRNKHYVSPTTKDQTSGGQFSTGVEQQFVGGRVAIFNSGRWSMRSLNMIKSLEWGVALLPKGKVRFSCPGTALLGIYHKTRYPEECWKFLKFVIGYEGQKLVINERADMPILISMVNDEMYINGFFRPEENRLFAKMLETVEAYPYVLGEGTWKVELQRKLELVEMGQIELEMACKEIAKEYEEKIVKKTK